MMHGNSVVRNLLNFVYTSLSFKVQSLNQVTSSPCVCMCVCVLCVCVFVCVFVHVYCMRFINIKHESVIWTSDA